MPLRQPTVAGRRKTQNENDMKALNDASCQTPAPDADVRTGDSSSVNSDLKNTQIGGTVNYVRDPEKQWFVLRVMYGQAHTARTLLNSKKIHYYQPMRYEVKKEKDSSRVRRSHFFPSLIFAYIESKAIDNLIKNKRENTTLAYYYNHFAIDHTGNNPPLTIPMPVMDNFIRLTSIEDEHIRVVDPNTCRYKRDDMVIITKGKFKGIVGRLARVVQEQRVVVNLEGVGMIATAYIPTGVIASYEEWKKGIDQLEPDKLT